jgi:sugar transferase (PEP-CTERM/EpsH1 system associated)
MKVLFIDEEIPIPVNTGKRTRTFNLLTRLSKSNEITYVAYADEEKEADKISQLKSQNIEVVTVEKRKISKESKWFYAYLLINLFSPYPYIVSGHYTKRMQQTIDQLLKTKKYDLIHCEISPYGVFVHSYRSIPKVIVAHNIESDIWRRYYLYEKDRLKKIYVEIQLKKLMKYESGTLRKFDCCITVSKKDADYFRDYQYSSDIKVVDNGVDIDYFRPRHEPTRLLNLVFTGSMDWRPNQDAVSYFIQEVFPIIKRENPKVTFTVVGRDPPPSIREISNQIPGVEVTGTVDDVRSYIAQAHLYVVPLRIGGGSRLKILEALAMGKAVISTTVGAEGLEVEDRKDIILVDDPVDFAEMVIKMLGDSHEIERLGTNGRLLVERRYSWDSLAQLQEQIWTETALKKRQDLL